MPDRQGMIVGGILSLRGGTFITRPLFDIIDDHPGDHIWFYSGASDEIDEEKWLRTGWIIGRTGTVYEEP